MFEGKITFERLNDKQFWLRMAPGLNVENDDLFSQKYLLPFDDDRLAAIRARVVTEGYFDIEDLPWTAPIAGMAELVAALHRQKFPTVFAFVYDEFWAIYYAINRAIESVLGAGFYRLPDFWAWYIDAATAESGWKPHRDKLFPALFDDRSPQSLTIWIPLTDATPLNGCMYLVPADRDPGYGKPQPQPNQFKYEDIRALPAKAGTVLSWNQCVLHWGAHSSPRAASPRISMAMEFQSGKIKAMNSPLSNPYDCPRLKFRLKLIGKQMLQYKHMYPLTVDMEKIAQRL